MNTPTSPSQIGPYRLLQPLGRGGMGIVYRAEHEQSGQTVALKTVTMADRGLLQSLRREIHALQGIRHPGIVRVLDAGVEAGVPWYTMELLSGRSLRDSGLIDGLIPTAPLAPTWTSSLRSSDPAPFEPASPRSSAGRHLDHVPQVLELVRDLCRPLGYLHGEGIVHRDLKPDNVLVRPDGTPVIVDFGLMARFSGEVSRESPGALAELGGTVWYIAPEQARGEMVDARADLYSLGCMLYELLTGSPPFVGPDPGRILEAHQGRDPDPPSHHLPGLDPAIDRLVLSLLAKSPRDRTGHADAVAHELAELAPPACASSDAPPSKAYLYRPRLAGREDHLQSLLARLGQVSRDGGDMVLVAGESGVGKTRLVLELANRAAKAGNSVISGECSQEGSRPALGCLRGLLQAMADRCRQRGASETRRLFGHRLKILAMYEDSLVEVPGSDEQPDPVDLPDAAARLRLATLLAEAVEEFTRDAPTILVLDDLQWADDLTLYVLGHLGERIARTHLLILATLRTDEAEPIRLLESCEVVLLPRLVEEELAQMVGDMLAADPPPSELCRFLARMSEGVPFFVAEYLRTAVVEGLLFRDPIGRWQVVGGSSRTAGEEVYEGLSLPASIEELLSRRLGGLEPGCRRVVESAAVLGREIVPELLARVSNLPDAELLRATKELLDRQILEEVDQGRLRFLHERMREVAYAGQPLERRPQLHRRAAEALEEQGAGAELRTELARHWEQAGEPTKARGHYLAAARRARRRHAVDEAEELFKRGIRLYDTASPEVTQARLELAAGVLQPRLRLEEADATLEAALTDARIRGDLADEARTLRAQSDLARVREDFVHSLDLGRRSLQLARKLGDRRLEGDICRVLAVTEHELGDVDRSIQFHLRAIMLAREANLVMAEAIALGNLAIAYKERGLVQAARRAYAESRELARIGGDRRIEGVAAGNMATLLYEIGEQEEAGRLMRESVQIAREVGDRYTESHALANLVEYQARHGQAEVAHRAVDEALELHQGLGQDQMAARALNSRGLLHLRLGEVDDAENTFREALRTDGTSDSPSAMEARIQLSRIALLRGRLDEVERSIGELERTVPSEMGPDLDLLQLRVELAATRGGIAHEELALLRREGRRQSRAGNVILQHDIRIAERTVAAVEEGRPVLGGRTAEDHPPGLRRWLERGTSESGGSANSRN